MNKAKEDKYPRVVEFKGRRYVSYTLLEDFYRDNYQAKPMIFRGTFAYLLMKTLQTVQAQEVCCEDCDGRKNKQV